MKSSNSLAKEMKEKINTTPVSNIKQNVSSKFSSSNSFQPIKYNRDIDVNFFREKVKIY